MKFSSVSTQFLVSNWFNEGLIFIFWTILLELSFYADLNNFSLCKVVILDIVGDTLNALKLLFGWCFYICLKAAVKLYSSWGDLIIERGFSSIKGLVR